MYIEPPSSRTILLRNCLLLTDTGVVAIAHFTLLHIDLRGCKVTDLGVSALRHCPLLQRADLSNLPHVTDVGATQLALHCPHLTSISLGPRITDATLAAFAVNCAYLEFFDLSGCPVTSQGVLGFATQSPATFLCLGGCRVGVRGVKVLRKIGVRFRL